MSRENEVILPKWWGLIFPFDPGQVTSGKL